MNENVTVGIHPKAQENISRHFSKKEKEIVRIWKNEFYISHARNIEIGASKYNYILIKPTSRYVDLLGIALEILVVFSSYEKLQARSFDAFDRICNEHESTRIEKICSVLISKDEKADEMIKNFLPGQEDRIIVPFTYKSFDNKSDYYLIRKQFSKYFYNCDLFGVTSPLTTDRYFFGREHIVDEIIGKHKSSNNSGLFGLRKTGKTSISFAIIRKLDITLDNVGVFIDCQDTSFNQKRWFTALYYVVVKIYEKLHLDHDDIVKSTFTPDEASKVFEDTILKAYNETNKKMMIIFDEIENITYGKSSSYYWCSELDFVYFWQSIRSVFQRNSHVFTVCIVGTNPNCIEQTVISGKDNPIFNLVEKKYIPGFTYQQTRAMVRKLGRIMGIKFEEGVYTRLTEDFGGHPFLIRNFCSALSKSYKDRPVTIDRSKYKECRDTFNNQDDYFEMIVSVLSDFYKDEYEMACMLSIDDYKTFKYFADSDPTYVNHLIGYGIITKSNEGYFDFNFDAIKQFLKRKQNSQGLRLTQEEKWQTMSSKRNQFELELRDMVRKILLVSHKNESHAKEHVIRKLHSNERKFYKYSLKELFDSNICDIYINDLKTLINANWESFETYFGKQNDFNMQINFINDKGRVDTHAKEISETDMGLVISIIDEFLANIKTFKDTMG